MLADVNGFALAQPLPSGPLFSPRLCRAALSPASCCPSPRLCCSRARCLLPELPRAGKAPGKHPGGDTAGGPSKNKPVVPRRCARACVYTAFLRGA